MAEPLSPDRLIAILKKEGVRVAEYPGWRTRERDDETGKLFGPVHLILNHHTAGTNSLKLVAETGRPDLPPPLAHIHLAKSGLATLTSAGRANHAGLMAQNAYVSFRDEHRVHPRPDGGTGTVDGNDVSYGIETENLGNGTDQYTREQYDAWVRINAAFVREYGWSENSVAMHSETSVDGKIDPKGPVEGYYTRGRFMFTGAWLRSDVHARLAHGASWTPGQTDPEEDEVTGAEIFNAVWKTDALPVSDTNETTWTGSQYLADTRFQLKRAHEKLDAILAHLGIEA